MAAEKKGFVLYFDACDGVMTLPPEQRGWLLSAVCDFAKACAGDPGASFQATVEKFTEMRPETVMACRFLCDTIQRDTGKWHTRREHLSRAAREREERRGGREIAEMRRYAQELRQNRAPQGGRPGEAWDYVE